MPECPECGGTLEGEDENDALRSDMYLDYYCPGCGRLYEEAAL